MKHFKFYSKNDILSITKIRRFETKLGERIRHLKTDDDWPEALAQSTAKYVLLGIPEDIGVKANHGKGGADTNWLPFLNSFLNAAAKLLKLEYPNLEPISLIEYFPDINKTLALCIRLF